MKILTLALLASSMYAAQPTKVNVIFHGLWTFSVQPHEIIAATPDMGAQHTYTAGNWRGALPLPRETALAGVTAGTATFDPRRNLIVDARLDKAAPAYLLHLPVPRAISSLMTVRPNFRTKYRVHEIATLQVLSYDAEDIGMLQLVGHGWEPQAVAGTVNLHVYSVASSAELARNEQHARLAFAARTALYPGLDLQLGRGTSHGRPRLNMEELPEGLMPGEIEEARLRVPLALGFVGSDACTNDADAGLVGR